jgi:hypothetical protein
MPFDLNAGALKDEILALLNAQVQAAREDIRKDLEGEATRIATRSSELAVLALQGNQLARENLDHLWAQAVALGSLVAMREEDRIAATMNLVAAAVVKVLIGALVASA